VARALVILVLALVLAIWCVWTAWMAAEVWTAHAEGGAQIAADWLGDDALAVTWSGPGCLYYARPDAPSAWLTCEAGTVVLRAGGDATTRPVAGVRLWVAENFADGAIAATRVPWRVALPLVAQ